MNRNVSVKVLAYFYVKVTFETKIEAALTDTVTMQVGKGTRHQLNSCHKEAFASAWKAQDWLWVHTQHPACFDLGFLSLTRYLELKASRLYPW